MFKKILIPDNVSTYLSSFFLPKKKIVGKHSFSGGKIVSITGEQYDVGSVVKERGQDGEFFLSIRFKPLSPEIKEAKIVNDNELREIRKKSDDLLNIFIPIGRYNNFDAIYDGGHINQNLILTKKGKEKRMSGFYDENSVYVSGFIARGPSSEAIDVVKNQRFEMGEGDFLFLRFSGGITYNSETNKEDFYLNEIGFQKGAGGSASITTSFYLENDGTNGGRISGEFPLSFSCPIGQVKSGNFLTFLRGNVKLDIRRDSLRYFLEKETLEGGCEMPVYETKTTYSIYPTFS